ncbi:hypothetical protein QBC42DRAFT_262081 [Cladorrhinum samala]|uniref:Uncharacterized protein n=1 Tax=Cladorrhinum samala TaxID=585594 RepID=A0AAV9HWK0_9PEZI|nr:hypothetical protein QBC42DRAFT_262081 [Cladorrhinum samala]
MKLALVITTLLINLVHPQYNPASPWYWATTVVTETVWTVCTVEETETVGPNLFPAPHALLDSKLTCPQVIEKAALTTNLVLPNPGEVLTSVTVQPPSSPTSCYALPTPPSSLEVVAFSANQISRDGGNANATDPVFFYVGNNATSPEYVGTLVDGNRIILDLSPDTSGAGRVALLLPGGESLVFDQAGVHHYDAGCRAVSSVMIPSFMAQVLSIATSPIIHASPPEPGPASGGYSSSITRRAMQSSNFTVQLVVESIIDAELQGPNMMFGPSACTFISRTPGQGEWPVFTWTCEYPGKQSAEKKCEAAFHNWLRPNSNSNRAARGMMQSGDDLFQYLPRFLSKVGGSLTNLLPGVTPILQTGIKWLSAAQNAVIDVAELGGESVCEVLHAFDEYKLIMSDNGLPDGPHTVGAYVSHPPVETIVGTLARHTTRMTREPSRAAIPSEKGGGENVTVTSFGGGAEGDLGRSLSEVGTSLLSLGKGVGATMSASEGKGILTVTGTVMASETVRAATTVVPATVTT